MTVRSSQDTDRRARAHDGSVRAAMPDVTAFLRELFGPRLVAHMAGVSDDKRVHKWVNGEGMNLRSQARLRAAYQIAWLLLKHDTAETVRAWFIGMNPQLEYEAPATVIREDRDRLAMVAAQAFIDGV